MIQKRSKKSFYIIISLALAFLLILSVFLFAFSGSKVSRNITVDEAQGIVNTTFSSLGKPTAFAAKKVLDNINIKVDSVDYGSNKDVILSCTYNAIDVKGIIENNKQDLIDSAYKFYIDGKADGKIVNATKICLSISKDIEALFETTDKISGEITLYLYEVSKGEFELFLSDDVVDTCTGGIISANNCISKMEYANYNGQSVNIVNNNTLRTGIKDCWALVNYDSSKPEVGNFLQKWYSSFSDEFNRNFIVGNRWLYLIQGLGTTLAITLIAGVIGMILGFVVAIIRCTNESTGRFFIVDRICRFYLTVIRGTPVMVQLLIIYFVLLLPIGVPKFLSAIICFGLNSGAYVAEIVRGGIMSIDKGQNEAGRSLGFNYPQTMIHFIMPQAFKAVLPSLANEFITLLKESSVAFYIGVADLTQGGLKIRSITYSNFMPLIAVALIYLAIVLILTRLVGLLERRLRKSEH